MPARSQAQQRYMAMCEHDPKHVKGHCPTGMTREQLREFAATPRTGLPQKVKIPTLLDGLKKRRDA